MPKNALATISAQRDSQSSDAIVRRWIVAIAELCGKELTPPLVELWCQLLADIDPSLLDRALKETAMTCGRFFPTPGEVRAQIDKAESNGMELRAVQEWEHALAVAGNDGRGFQALDGATQHAIRAAGGLHWIESCPQQELQWARKRFIEDYTLIHETRQTEHLLSDGEAKKIIHQLAAQSKQPRPRELSPIAVPVTAKPLTPDDPIRADFAALREQLSQPEPKTTMTEAEFEARRELLKRQSAEIRERETVPNPK